MSMPILPDVDVSDAPACPSCGVAYTDHPGLHGTCAALVAARAEISRLRDSLRRWGRWCYSPEGVGGPLFEAAVEGTPEDCFPGACRPEGVR